jgi:hypothetical protein
MKLEIDVVVMERKDGGGGRDDVDEVQVRRPEELGASSPAA